jgi:hypothetical protein
MKLKLSKPTVMHEFQPCDHNNRVKNFHMLMQTFYIGAGMYAEQWRTFIYYNQDWFNF